MKTEKRRLSWQPLEGKPFIIFRAVGLAEGMTVVPALCSQMPRGKSHSLRGGILFHRPVVLLRAAPALRELGDVSRLLLAFFGLFRISLVPTTLLKFCQLKWSTM